MEEQSAPRVFDALRRYRLSSLVIVLLAIALSVGVTLLLNNEKTVSARIVPKMPDKASVTGSDSTSESTFVRYVKQRALFVTSDRVLADVSRKRNGAEPVAELRKSVTADASPDGESITIDATADTVWRASRIANAVISAYQDESRAESRANSDDALNTLEQQRAKVIDSIPRGPGSATNTIASAASQTLSQLDTQAAQIRLSASQFGDGVSFVDKADTDSTGSFASIWRDAAIGLVLGVLIAAAVAWFRADRDRRVRDFEDVSDIVDEPLLGEIEALSGQERLGLHDLSRPPLRSYRFAASGLRTIVGRGVVVVTGASLGDGSTTTTLQLASAAARDGVRVLVVDSVLRSHELSDILGLHNDPHGLTALATGSTSIEQCARAIYLGNDVVFWAVPAGQYTDHVRDYLQSTPLERAIMHMRAHYDLVLVDSAPLTAAPEITPVIRQSDGVIVVLRRNGTVRSLRKLREQLKLFGGSITGFVFTFAEPTRNSRAEPPPPPQALAQRYQ